ncbi:MAG: putative transrane protein [Gammaproteobacteria bacterium]|nr:putative transrane protein [Gammaproteobacteria bacterium]
MKYLFKKQFLTPMIVMTGMLSLPATGFTQDFTAENYETPEMMEFTPDFIKAEDVKKMIDAGDSSFVLVDNAPAMAFEEEHIPDAISFPFVAQITPPVNLPRNKTLIMYCPCGPDDADSIAMAKQLRMFGYFRVKILHGGWFEWLDKGYPIFEKEAGAEDA